MQYPSRFRLLAVFLLALGLMTGAVAHAESAALTTLYAFTGSEGANPFSGLVQGADGALYGTAYQGGVNNTGTIFKIAPSGALSVLYTFSAASWDPTAQANINADGCNPLGLIQGADGDFYGVTPCGGLGGSGTVFKITPDGTLKTLHTFSVLDPYSQCNSDGAHPYAGLVQGADGDLYGTTHDGGVQGYGTIFRITPRGGFDRLHSFSALDFNGINKDGANPAASLALGADGNLYGTTYWGGAYGNGTVFRISPTRTFTLLYAFSAFTSTNSSGYGINAEGANPSAGLAPADDGGFYGAAFYGGAAGFGSLFKITPDGVLTTLYSFSRRYGAGPDSLIRGVDGNLYGTACQGGYKSDGTVFCLTPDGSMSLLHAFSANRENTAGTTWYNRDGCRPSGLIQGADGSLYGTTYSGGAGGMGTIFHLKAR
ncbi:MAG TPA: choice-of-anchor tandem repeat GloVer-containing protein [Chthonomonadaceae bacterium]|nr:choice-of-anchor tandem repeat GloVer-containing protein [Chthonomonadaceae bacterium]